KRAATFEFQSREYFAFAYWFEARHQVTRPFSFVPLAVFQIFRYYLAAFDFTGGPVTFDYAVPAVLELLEACTAPPQGFADNLRSRRRFYADFFALDLYADRGLEFLPSARPCDPHFLCHATRQADTFALPVRAFDGRCGRHTYRAHREHRHEGES